MMTGRLLGRWCAWTSFLGGSRPGPRPSSSGIGQRQNTLFVPSRWFRLVESHRPELLSILYKDQTFKEGWQQWIGASRHGTILGALLARTQWQDGRERSGVLPGPTV